MIAQKNPRNISFFRNACILFKISIFFSFIFFLLLSFAHAAQLTLGWDESSSKAVSGYTLHYGTSSHDYADSVSVGKQNRHTLSGLTIGETYYFAVTARSQNGLESSYSNQVKWTIQDQDGDQLSDYEEESIHNTDKQRSDTDGDGLDDGWEVAKRLDPLADSASRDADGDGYSNLDEYLAQTDPRNTQSHPQGDPSSNQPPVAEAGSTQQPAEGSKVVLNGSNSFDPENKLASYSWKQTSGPEVELKNSHTPKAVFTAPDVDVNGASLTFQLTVTDVHGDSSTDECIVNITWNNAPPDAEAGNDQTVQPGAQVSLDGTQSSDSDDDIAAYSWTQVHGPSVALNGSDTATPELTAPSDISDGASLAYQLLVTDQNGLRDSDLCRINVTSHATPPEAEAGQMQTAKEGQTVYLNGIRSTDDSALTGYAWKQINGPNVALSNPGSVNPSFVAPRVGAGGQTLEFELTVINDSGLIGSDVVTVQVQDNGASLPARSLSQQAIVLKDSESGRSSAIDAQGGTSLVALQLRDPEAFTDASDKPGQFDYKFFDFQLKVASPGDTAEILVHFEQPLQPGSVWYKYDPDSGWTSYKQRAQISQDRMTVRLELKDGGYGDQDGQANGVIVDPSGPAEENSSSASGTTGGSSSGGGGGGCILQPQAGADWSWLLLGLLPGLLMLITRLGDRLE